MFSSKLGLHIMLWMPSLTSAFLLHPPKCWLHKTSLDISKGVGSVLSINSLLRDQCADSELPDLLRIENSDRRGVLAGLSTMLLPVLIPGKSWAADPISPFGVLKADSTDLDVGLLESRVTENLLSPPSYGMESPDIYYPSWFKGAWKASSKTVDVQAPCGTNLFGGDAKYDNARNEIGTVLTYESRFISDGTGRTIADREFNVQSIAKAAMGQYSVLDISLATPNRLTCILEPKGSPRMLKVDLIALSRRQETISDIKFDCSEVTREIIAPVNGDNPQSPPTAAPMAPASSATILKEVETTSLYTFNPAKNEVRCQQRSATFLLPSQSSPIAYKMWEASRGRPIDTRFYDVRYTKTS